MSKGKTVRSARGALVDFDLLKIKQQMASAPPPTTVKAREDFIERKNRRRLSRQIKQIGSIVDLSNEKTIEPINETKVVAPVQEETLTVNEEQHKGKKHADTSNS